MLSEQEINEEIEEFFQAYSLNDILSVQINKSDVFFKPDQLAKHPFVSGAYVGLPVTKEGKKYLGSVFIFSDNALNRADLQATLRHEILGHYGINTLEKEEKRSLLLALQNSRNDPLLKPEWDEVEKLYPDVNKYLLSEEFFAYVAEQISPQLIKTLDHQEADKIFQDTVLKRSRRMTGYDIFTIATWIASGIQDQSRTQKTFPKPGNALRVNTDESKYFTQLEQAVQKISSHLPHTMAETARVTFEQAQNKQLDHNTQKREDPSIDLDI